MCKLPAIGSKFILIGSSALPVVYTVTEAVASQEVRGTYWNHEGMRVQTDYIPISDIKVLTEATNIVILESH